MKLSIAIITHNEEKNIESCLKNIIDIADEIIVVDCESTDKTVEIVKKFPVKLFFQKNNPNLNINKSFAVKQASCEWVMYIDPDERLSDELKTEIKQTINTILNDISGYLIPRRNYYFGKWIKHGGKYPDHQLRLFRNGKAYFPCKHVHERMVVSGKIGTLKNPLEHYTYKTIEQFINRFNFYTTFQAHYMKDTGVKFSMATVFQYVFLQLLRRFIDRFILKLGFLEGWTGFLIFFIESLFYPVSFMKFWQLTKAAK